MAYATVTDLLNAESSVALPSDPGELNWPLDVASLRVDELLIGAVYDTDPAGAPTAADVVAALKTATIAQALFMVERATAEAGGMTGANDDKQSMTIGGMSWARGGAGAAGTAGSGYGTRYAPDAVAALRVAGLLPISPRRW